MRQLRVRGLLHRRPIVLGLEQFAFEVGLGPDTPGRLESPPRCLGARGAPLGGQTLSRLLQACQQHRSLALGHRDLIPLDGQLPFKDLDPLLVPGGELGRDADRLGVLDLRGQLSSAVRGDKLCPLLGQLALRNRVPPPQVLEADLEVDKVLLGRGRRFPGSGRDGGTREELIELVAQMIEKTHEGWPGRDREVSTRRAPGVKRTGAD